MQFLSKLKQKEMLMFEKYYYSAPASRAGGTSPLTPRGALEPGARTTEVSLPEPAERGR